MSLFLGTSGWAYREWRGGFYPDGLPERRFLEHYGRTLSACEINATFYRLQSATTFLRWAASVPGSFRFTVKAHRRLTHRRRLGPQAGADVFLERFLESLASLRSSLGCILFQFPPLLERDDGALDRLLARLPEDLRFACEFRHSSWQDPAVSDALAERGGTLCLADTEALVPNRLPPGAIAYVRLRAERYGEDARAGWLELLRREAAARDVYAFAKHEGAPAGDPFVGVGLAQWLIERV